MINLFNDFINLIYPRLCGGCSAPLLRNEHLICTKCLYHIPKTNFHKDTDNHTSQIFWGRVNFVHASSFLYFNKGGIVQRLMHNLKYKGQKKIGFELGKLMGYELKGNHHFEDIDLIIPVPLHSKRERQRGYNQSEWIAKGLSEVMNIPFNTTSLYRSVASVSQTKQKRQDRWENVESIFKLRKSKEISGKHILLIDDVVTTGATLEACANTLLKAEDVKISIATLAYANMN